MASVATTDPALTADSVGPHYTRPAAGASEGVCSTHIIPTRAHTPTFFPPAGSTDTAVHLHQAAALLSEAAALLSKTDISRSCCLHTDAHNSIHNHAAPLPSAVSVSTENGLQYETDRVPTTPLAAPKPSESPTSTRAQDEIKHEPQQSSSASHPTAWDAVEKVFSEFDKKEIESYQEDIDALLTFTGLYSAVLTAFVVVSYPLLQQDTTAESLQVLRTIANQTNIAPLSPPSISVIRVNILWFASLVISLATASFAIIVKQWLRAYMTFATTSPQGMLRIRHFRRQGLEKWKVFEIASMLPLLIQISLALFFAGLCLFTVTIHPTIGQTTLPLVSVWAILLCVFVISPTISLPCPFNSPLSRIISHGVAPLVMQHIPKAVVRGLFMMFDLITDFRCDDVLFELYIYFKVLYKHFPRYMRRETMEMNQMKGAEHDLEILVSADALQANDYALATIINRALEQSKASWVQTIEFAFRVIGNRVPLAFDGAETPTAAIIETYSSLSSDAKEAVADILQAHAITLDPGVPPQINNHTGDLKFPKNWKTMVKWALCIIAERKGPDVPAQLLSIYCNSDISGDRGVENIIWRRITQPGSRITQVPGPVSSETYFEVALGLACADSIARRPSADSDGKLHTWDDSFGWLENVHRVLLASSKHYRISGRRTISTSLAKTVALAAAEQLNRDYGSDLGSSSSLDQPARTSSQYEALYNVVQMIANLFRISRHDLDLIEIPGGRGAIQHLLRWQNLTKSEAKRIGTLSFALSFEFQSIWRLIDSVYLKSGDHEVLMSIIHDLVVETSQCMNFIQVLKSSLLALNLMLQYTWPVETEHRGAVNEPSKGLEQGKDILLLLMYKFLQLYETFMQDTTSASGGQSLDSLELQWHLAALAWDAIAAHTSSDSISRDTDSALILSAIPDLTYLMLWTAAGPRGAESLRIASYHPQLLREFADAEGGEQARILANEKPRLETYIQSRGLSHALNPKNDEEVARDFSPSLHQDHGTVHSHPVRNLDTLADASHTRECSSPETTSIPTTTG